jgi:nucleoside 2-deoxyribosyltransferase
MKKLVYIAGPLYTPAERAQIEKIGEICKAKGFATYLPHKDGGIYPGNGPTKKFFDSDLKAMNKCNFCIAVLDGFDVDSGTSFEIGYIYAKRKPVIGLLIDIRFPNPEEQINLMIINGVNRITKSYEELGEVISEYK